MLGKTFGVELEFIAPYGMNRADVAAALCAAGVEAFDAGYTHATSRKWKLVSDASVTGAGAAMELVSPILEGERGIDQLRKACEVLTAKGCTTNRTCGLHVHVGASNMTVPAMRLLAILYSDFEDVLDSLMPASRRANMNTYLQPVKGINKARMSSAADVRTIANQINNGSRYAKLNFTSHWKHGTVEFRHHGGTVNANKAVNWVSACVRMVVAAEADARNNGAVTPTTAARRRPSGALGTIYDLVARPEGCTREEARRALGRRSPPQMSRLTEDAGVPLRRVGQRFFLAEQSAVANVASVPAAYETTLEGWVAKLGLSEEEGAFWKARQEFFAADRSNERVNWTPGSRMAARAGL